MEKASGYSIGDVINNLQDENSPINTGFLHTFSDISFDDLSQIKGIWAGLSTDRKVHLLQHLLVLMESDTLISCDDFSKFAIEDQDPQVKCQAIALLWESNDIKLVPAYIEMLVANPDASVNAAAADALGKFVLLGELDEIPRETADAVRDALLTKYKVTTHDRTKQKVVESLGYIADDEITSLIKKASKDESKSWQLSALVAIAHSANEVWDKFVVEKLSEKDQDVLIEAIKAAGELEIASAKEPIIQILQESASDEEEHLQAILALSKIGGRDVRQILEELLETSENTEETDLLEIALENMDLTDGIVSFDFFSDDE